MEKDSIKNQWESYKNQVISKDAGPVQLSETKQAFYAGAKVVMVLIGSTGGMTEEEAIQAIEEWDKEINANFLETVKFVTFPPAHMN